MQMKQLSVTQKHLSWAYFCTSCPIRRIAEPPCSSWARMDIMAWANKYVCSPWHTIFCSKQTRMRSDYKNIIINKYSDLKKMLTANSGRFFSRFCSPPSSSVAREVRRTLEKTSSCWQAVDTLVISPWYPASEINYRQHTHVLPLHKHIWAIWASLTHFSSIFVTLTVKLSIRQSGWASASL